MLCARLNDLAQHIRLRGDSVPKFHPRLVVSAISPSFFSRTTASSAERSTKLYRSSRRSARSSSAKLWQHYRRATRQMATSCGEMAITGLTCAVNTSAFLPRICATSPRTVETAGPPERQVRNERVQFLDGIRPARNVGPCHGYRRFGAKASTTISMNSDRDGTFQRESFPRDNRVKRQTPLAELTLR